MVSIKLQFEKCDFPGRVIVVVVGDLAEWMKSVKFGSGPYGAGPVRMLPVPDCTSGT